MELQSKTKKLVRMKHLTIGFLVLMFLWWGSNAVLKFWSQPLTTDINRRFGDNNEGTQLLNVTDTEGPHCLETKLKHRKISPL